MAIIPYVSLVIVTAVTMIIRITLNRDVFIYVVNVMGLARKSINQRLNEQNGKCGICLEVFAEVPCIDHDHLTLEVRGLLCAHCNSMLGFARDNLANLHRGIEYLSKQDRLVVRNL